ncbi:MAG: MFS transporter [Deltaproteobacteria bacterium]|nr:MFS transporter [Deltaproteobacteria bacterium]
MNAKSSSDEKISSFRFLLRALGHRNYRLFFVGQSFSLIGTWMQQIAMSWLVYKLTNSAFMLGLIGFTGQAPSVIFGSFAGVYADRLNRRNLLIATQALSMLQALLLAFLTLSGSIAVWHLVVLSLLLGTVNSFDMPARHSFVIDMVKDKSDLGNAIALNSFMFNSARLIGPSIAGILIAYVGEGVCFLLNGVSFFFIILALMAMEIIPKQGQQNFNPVLHELKEGFQYVAGFAPIRYIILLVGLISLLGMPYVVLMPIFARDILHGGSHTLGFLMGATGIGALTGALFLASRKSVIGLGRLIAISTGVFGCGLVAFSFSRWLPLSLCLMMIAGFGIIVTMASSNTIVQTIVDEDKRGRVMSFYSIAFMGMAPFGSLIGGIIAHKIGAPFTIVLCGVSSIAGAVYFYKKLPEIRKYVRPIYLRMGIIQEMPTELQ